jgi:hypothetical protein
MKRETKSSCMRRIGKSLLFAIYLSAIAAWITDVAAFQEQRRESRILCGNEGQRVCSSRDWEYWAQIWTTARVRPCEFDLSPAGGLCVNATRRTLRRWNNWTAWALAEQRYSIGANESINRIATVGSHNSFSNAAQGFTNPITRNQSLSITGQLEFGVRALELDVRFFAGHLRLCHGKKMLGCLGPRMTAGRLLADGLIEVRNWLESHPGEVLILKFDDYLPGGARPLSELLEMYLGDLAYRRQPGTSRWPTMREIRGAGKQALVILQNAEPPAGASLIWRGSNYHALHASQLRRGAAECGAVGQGRDVWVEVSEGLAVSNAVGLPTGFVGDAEVRAAVQCNVGVIGMDYVDSLPGAAWPAYRRKGRDTRLSASVWSWKDGDFGANGPASLDVLSGRWESNPAAGRYPLACSAVPGGLSQERQWRITRNSYPWDVVAGPNACHAEFGPDYDFSFPLNGYENRHLDAVAKSAGAARLWLAYQKEAFDE